MRAAACSWICVPTSLRQIVQESGSSTQLTSWPGRFRLKFSQAKKLRIKNNQDFKEWGMQVALLRNFGMRKVSAFHQYQQTQQPSYFLPNQSIF
ncbi:hypothetical protein [Microvirga sp. KLBC 81]|uniref:hypothetical protein n=1 Tax=Microvirga sp. KLBC 81 TaxID=1862707 RepID=UPI00105776EA|nr:hypothetical protein [Microvirga sp. KLBC 81]